MSARDSRIALRSGRGPTRRGRVVVAAAVTAAGLGLAGCTASAPAPAPASTCDDGCSSSATSADRTGYAPAAPVGWKRLFEQDFDRDASLGLFSATYPGWAGYDGGIDTSRTVGRPVSQRGVWSSDTTTTVHDGVFDCRLYTKKSRPQVCALTPTPNEKWWAGQRYGRYSVRFHVDPVPGYKVAWLLWPETGRWSDGEVDFPEGDLDGTATASTHTVGAPETNAYLHDTGTRLRGWHVATIAWRPGRITFTMDGRSWTSTDSAGLPSKRMHWILQTETSLSPSAPPVSVSGHLLIDWVTVDAWRG